MLVIQNISKTYKTGDLVQTALNGVSLNLRDNEFVAILGPSGSGKTTLLNIIGGLDRYDSGDLIINNVSTKDYKDRNWDTYRNHTIGFVFQSYNLIPHQSVLSNVELALTIAGISKRERRKRALKALDEVGLKDQAHKKPNQMSGGQMQRVAIARALVNNPDILLADEPTGALDTKTSIQVMNLLKEVAKDRLVVMVTHNPELANEYANRIIRLQDGVIISDSNPYVIKEVRLKRKADNVRKARMSIFTALSLSFNNLLTKKGRTILTAFAGSIGIIGIALILSLSQGFQNYIDKIQEDTLSSYPLTITSETADMTSMILSMVSDKKENVSEGNELRERQYLSTMFSSIGTNDLAALKTYIQDHNDEIKDDISAIKYAYSVTPEIYTIDVSNKLDKLNPSSLLNTMYSSSATSYLTSFSSSVSMGIFAELNEDIDSYADQYEVLAGRWPSNYDELIVVLSEPNSISDLLVYSLGLRPYDELKTIISDVMTDGETDISNEPLIMTYDDLLKIDLRLIKATDRYKYNSKYSVYEDMSSDDEYMLELYENALKLKIVGVVCPKDPDSTNAMSVGVNFTKDLTQYVIDEASKTEIVRRQLTNKDTDVFSGDTFSKANEDSKKESKLDFDDMVSIDEDMLKDAFKFNVDEDSFVDILGGDEVVEIIKEPISDYAMNVYAKDVQDVITLGTTIVGVEISTYTPSNIDYLSMSLKLNNASDFVSNINADAIKTILTNSPTKEMFVDYKNIIDNLTNTDYDNLTAGVKLMLTKYFEALQSVSGYDAVNKTVPVIMSSPTSIKYGTITNNTDPIDIMKTVAQDKDAMERLSTIYNKLIASSAINDVSSTTGTVVTNYGKYIGEALGGLFGEDMMEVDTDKFAEAFKFDMDEDELSRLMETMLSGTEEKSYSTNLIELGYQDVDDPSSISFYFNDFDSKERFLDFLDKYNKTLNEEDELHYTDITGLLMSSVKTIVDSVTYVLIAFVSISLVVSSIMIAVITLISVMERTKEIGILRAMGASKYNVSSIFNAETFIIGLLSGLLGVGVTFALIPPINALIHSLTGNFDINAVLPNKYAIILVLISVFLTIIAGIIPSRKAAKQDPVIALRTE